MLEIASEGAKVLHNRSIEVGQKFNIPIITKSTFTNAEGTIIQEKIEDTKVKSIVKNDNIILVDLKYENNSNDMFNKLYDNIIKNGIIPSKFSNLSTNTFESRFLIKSTDLNKFQHLLETDLKNFSSVFSNVSKICIIGHGIMNDTSILMQILKILKLNTIDLLDIEITESKITLIFKEKISNNILEQLHQELFIQTLF